MDKLLLIFIFLLAITTVALASDNRIELNNLLGPPQIIKYQGGVHAVFDMGGTKYLYKVVEKAKPYPQCNAVQEKGKELMVVGQNPKGYAYFVEGNPIAFKTDHNPNWNEIVKRTLKR